MELKAELEVLQAQIDDKNFELDQLEQSQDHSQDQSSYEEEDPDDDQEDDYDDRTDESEDDDDTESDDQLRGQSSEEIGEEDDQKKFAYDAIDAIQSGSVSDFTNAISNITDVNMAIPADPFYFTCVLFSII